MVESQVAALPPPEPLITGMRMDRDEFIRRWEALPGLKKAELIEGIVFVQSPLGFRHSNHDTQMILCVGTYAAHTPGVGAGTNATHYMLESAPQPDAFLRIVEERGGSSRVVNNFLHGAPELAVEICDSSTDYDFGPKLKLYKRAGVREYITLETHREQLIWRVLVDGRYMALVADKSGVIRSRVFPGLWLDPRHVWMEDGRGMLALLQQGLASEEHAVFAERLRGEM